MELRRGYKQTEVSLIPEDWQLESLEDLCVKNGLVRGPFGGSLKKEFFVDSGYKVYEQRNAIYRDPELGAYYIDNGKYDELKRFALQEGDFIVSCSGTIGRIYQMPKDMQSGIINQALLKIRLDKQKILDEFFLYYFDWNEFQKRITDNTQGGAMQNLVGMGEFRKILIPLPSPTEQHTIAAALSDLDELLTALDALIAKKRLIKQGTMQELLTGKRRLPGFVGEWATLNMTEHSTLKARIGWHGLTTAEYMTSGDYRLVTGTDFVDGKVDWERCYFVDRKRHEQDKYIQVHIDDVLLTKDGTIGKVAYVDHLLSEATLNSGVFVIRPKDNKYHPRFLYHILCSRIFDGFLNQLQAGSTINHLYQKDFVNFNFLAPEFDEQNAIADILSDMDTEIAALETRREKTRLLKRGMMQELLTGRIRLI